MGLTPRGFLISFEGVEGSGKSTQAGRLKAGFERKEVPVLLTHEPGGTETGRDLRRLLLNGRDIEPLTELLLFLADRHQQAQLTHSRQHMRRIGPLPAAGFQPALGLEDRQHLLQ